MSQIRGQVKEEGKNHILACQNIVIQRRPALRTPVHHLVHGPGPCFFWGGPGPCGLHQGEVSRLGIFSGYPQPNRYPAHVGSVGSVLQDYLPRGVEVRHCPVDRQGQRIALSYDCSWSCTLGKLCSHVHYARCCHSASWVGGEPSTGLRGIRDSAMNMYISNVRQLCKILLTTNVNFFLNLIYSNVTTIC